jgi:hypothetical protein
MKSCKWCMTACGVTVFPCNHFIKVIKERYSRQTKPNPQTQKKNKKTFFFIFHESFVMNVLMRTDITSNAISNNNCILFLYYFFENKSFIAGVLSYILILILIF